MNRNEWMLLNSIEITITWNPRCTTNVWLWFYNGCQFEDWYYWQLQWCISLLIVQNTKSFRSAPDWILPFFRELLKFYNEWSDIFSFYIFLFVVCSCFLRCHHLNATIVHRANSPTPSPEPAHRVMVSGWTVSLFLVMSIIGDFTPFLLFLSRSVYIVRMLCSDYFLTDKPEGRMRPSCVEQSIAVVRWLTKACYAPFTFWPHVFVFCFLSLFFSLSSHAPQAIWHLSLLKQFYLFLILLLFLMSLRMIPSFGHIAGSEQRVDLLLSCE